MTPSVAASPPGAIDVLRGACHGGPPVLLDALGEAAVAWAAEAGLGPLLARVVARDPGAAASPLWPRVQGMDLTARFLAAQQVDAMTEILDACTGRVPPPVLLKGIALCDRHYPEPHLRPMRDLDVLMEEEALGAVETILGQLGYRQSWTRPRAFYAEHHHSAPFRHPDTGIWIDVHRALFPPQSQLGGHAAFAPCRLRVQIRPSDFRGRPVRRLSDELQLVHLASHWARGLRTVGGMIAMADVAFLLRNPAAVDWTTVLAWTRGTAAARHLHLLLSYLTRHRLVAVAPDVLACLAGRRTPRDRFDLAVAHRLLDRYVVDGRPFGSVLTERVFIRLWRIVALGQPLLRVRAAGGRRPEAAADRTARPRHAHPPASPGRHANDAAPPANGTSTPIVRDEVRPAASTAAPRRVPAGAPRASVPSDLARPVRHTDVQTRVVGGATVVLDRQRSQIHCLNETAGYVWDRCDGRRSAVEIGHELAQAFGVPVEVAQHDVGTIVRQLEDAGLVELREPATVSAPHQRGGSPCPTLTLTPTPPDAIC